VSRLLLVRHGRAAAGWDSDLDPGLDDLGRDQAEKMATELASVGPVPVVMSPMLRTRQTAAALERRWGITGRVEPRVGEIATTDGVGLADRGTWLRELLGRRWAELDSHLQAWRAELLDALTAIDTDAVVVTHFVAINVAVGSATGDDRIVNMRPEFCSVTALQADAGTLRPARAEG
jgi:broad specificity phosphatase PhoE